MENDSTCDCVNKVMAMIPMPVPGLTEEFARKLCAWRVPTDIVAITIIEMLLGTDRLEKVDRRLSDARTALVNAFTSGYERVSELKEAAAILKEECNLSIWHEICRHLNKRGFELSMLEAQALFQLFKKGKIANAADAERKIRDLRANHPRESNPEPGNPSIPRTGPGN